MFSTSWLDPLVEACGLGSYQLQILVQAGGGYFASAACFVILGSVTDHLPSRRWEMTDVHTGLLQSMIFVGVTGGTLIGGVLSDRKGRRISVILSYFLFLVAGSLLVCAQGYYTMVAGCLLFGCAGGVGLPAFNTLLIETSPAGSRGDLICLASFIWFVGELYGAACVWFFKDADIPLPGAPLHRLHWRGCLVAGLMPVLPVLVYAFVRLNESPRFLASQGRVQEAERVLAAMARANSVQLPRSVLQSQEDGGVEASAPAPPSFREGLIALSRWPVSGSTAGLMVLCMVTNFAYYGLIFSLPQVLNDQPPSIFGGASAQLFLVTLFKLPGILLAFCLVRAQSIGHKVSMAALFGGCAASALAYPWFLSMGTVMMALGAACMLKLAISAVFIVLYVFVLEVYPTQIRSTGMAICTMAGRLGAILSPPVYVLATAHAGISGYFASIALCALVAGGTSLVLPQDTKGKSLGESETASESSSLLSFKK